MQSSVTSLQVLAHSAPATHGSPVWVHAPPLQTSAPLQNRPSSQGAVFGGWPHAPMPLQRSFVQTLPSSVQGMMAGAKQLSAVSLQVAAHSSPPPQGSPVPPQAPMPLQVSVAVQKRASLHAAPTVRLGCRQTPDPHTSRVHWLPSSGQTPSSLAGCP